MGRDKSQRTKGNVKPASSGRTAELLFPQTGIPPAGSGSSSGFSAANTKPTFESLVGSGSFVPILDDSLSPALAIPLRKLGKKDPVTKIKALAELITLCTTDPSTPPQMLPFFPTIYAKLCTDESKKVREQAQTLLQSIAVSVGRNLATQLKQLLPSWYLSINDTFPPASSIALNTFKLVFPTEEKQLQTVRFGLVEICSLVKERIFSEQEFEKITGLEGLRKILSFVETEYVFEILKQDQFWTIAGNECGQIRGSFYSLLSQLGESNPTLIPKSKLTKTLIDALKEEKFELPLLWNCFLTLTMNGVFNEKEIARKELLVLCRNSFYGNSTQLGPLVLPLVDKIDVGEEIFAALEIGFTGTNSNHERLAIIRTYAETLAYFLQHDSTSSQIGPIPPSIFPFLSQHLKQACEFGRTISPMLKSDTTFYQCLIDFCTEETVISSKEFGWFILSFLQPKKSVSFESEISPILNYDSLPENKRQFTQKICTKMLAFKSYKPFSIVSRCMKSTKFFQDVLEQDLKKIPAVFDFNLIEPDSKIEALRISLDLIQIFPDLPTALLLFSTIYDSFFNGSDGQDSDAFIHELDGFDELKPIKNWFRMDLFTRLNSSSVLKYVLRKGTSTFPPGIVQEKIDQLCTDSFNIEIVRDLLQSNSKTDLTEVWLKTCDLYLNQGCKSEELEQLCLLILEKDVLSKNRIYEKLLNPGLYNCSTVQQVNHLINNFALKIDIEFSVAGIDDFEKSEFTIESDFLIFHAFKFPKLLYMSSLALDPPAGLRNPLPLVKKVIFECKVRLGLEMNEETLVQIALNLIYVQCLCHIYEHTSNVWEAKLKIPAQFTEELSSCQAKIIEKIVETKSTRAAFWTQLTTKTANGNQLWTSKYPVKYFLDIARKMELNCFYTEYNAEKLAEAILNNIEWIFDNFLIDAAVSGSELIPLLEMERNDRPEQFQFEKLFACIPDTDKQRLFDLLALTMELMRRNPTNTKFLSSGTCWISAWIRMCKNIQHTKSNYLWILQLSRAVILIDQLVKENASEFVQEYVEFHAANLYPNVYAWIGQLLDPNSDTAGNYWRLKTGEIVISALSCVPKLLFNHIEQDSGRVFERFVPILKREEIAFKIGAYKLMRKVMIKDDVIIPKELLEYLESADGLGDEDEDEDGINVEEYGKNESIVSYLLAWDILLTSQPNTADLANFVKSDQLLPKLLSLIFLKLLPQHSKHHFETEFKLSSSTTISIPHLTCYVLHHVLSCLQFTTRWWWSGLLKQRDKVLVEKIITQYLSGKLIAEELSRVRLEEGSQNVTVLTHPGCNELVARYKFEETSITLTISLPLNYPLGPISVQVSDQKLHSRISQLLNTRSPSLSAGLKLWKESLDGTYKDVDECTICFYVIHHATKQLPKLDCRTCRKKFHATCLYKWFSTSNKSECPLCKSLW